MVYLCHGDTEKCIFVWTILSQIMKPTPQITYGAFNCFTVPQRTENVEKLKLSRQVVLSLIETFGQNPNQCPVKICRGLKPAFFHIIE